jgi:hypothetical protein
MKGNPWGDRRRGKAAVNASLALLPIGPDILSGLFAQTLGHNPPFSFVGYILYPRSVLDKDYRKDIFIPEADARRPAVRDEL